jgi:hypothetical protein
MKRHQIILIFFIAILAGCEDKNNSASPEKPGFVVCKESDIQAHEIEGVSTEDGVDICNSIKAAKGGADPSDFLYKKLASAVLAMKIKGSKDQPKDISYQLMNIVEARGQISDDKAAANSFEVVFKMFSAWNGRITPTDVNIFLRSIGDSAKNLSDDGLTNMMALVLQQKKAKGE